MSDAANVEKSSSQQVGFLGRVQHQLDAVLSDSVPYAALTAAAVSLTLGVGPLIAGAVAAAGLGYGLYNGQHKKAFSHPIREMVSVVTGVALALSAASAISYGIAAVATKAVAGTAASGGFVGIFTNKGAASALAAASEEATAVATAATPAVQFKGLA